MGAAPKMRSNDCWTNTFKSLKSRLSKANSRLGRRAVGCKLLSSKKQASMSKNVVVVGVQWGDEGKGKVVDALAEHFDIVARYQGGANAGHTVFVGTNKYVLQLLPTGIIRPDKSAAIGNGVVVDPEALQREIRQTEGSWRSIDHRLKVSDRAHLILPYHRAHEVAAESARGDGKIGTTAKGIGPAYEDKAGRRGLRACDLRDPAKFREKCLPSWRRKTASTPLFSVRLPWTPRNWRTSICRWVKAFCLTWRTFPST